MQHRRMAQQTSIRPRLSTKSLSEPQHAFLHILFASHPISIDYSLHGHPVFQLDIIRAVVLVYLVWDQKKGANSA